ncbi:MAG: pseudaminic acid biosynthesis-associated methylase [Burkholderiales bacterium]
MLNDQEKFWAGEFGNDYNVRNNVSPRMQAANEALLGRATARATAVRSVLELGANVGSNMPALAKLLPDATLSAVEINAAAAGRLRAIPGLQVYEQSLLSYSGPAADLVLIKGVLCHIHPDNLQSAYEIAFRSSKRYICIADYYNRTPIEVNYRGHSGKLFKRDFAGEMMDAHPLQLVDYGFVYRRDPLALDEFNWFLLERKVF